MPTPSKSRANSSASAKHSRPSSSPSLNSPKTLYLILYNSLAALSWGYVLFLLVQHLSSGFADSGLKAVVGGGNAVERLVGRSRTSYTEFGNTVRWVQTFALLEVAHSALGLVRSGLGTTVAQLSSRILMVWYICLQYPQVTSSPAYASMVLAWSFTEVVRYSHYVTGLLGVKLPALEWLRYTTFYPLYPLGAGSEAWLIFRTAAYARHLYGLPGFFGTVGLVSIWPPALLMMMIHMRQQRYKHLTNAGKHKVSSSTRAKTQSAQSQSSSPAPAQVHATTSGTDTPTRVTRSRAKAEGAL